MSIVKLTGGGAYEQTLENNHAAEFLKRELNEHKNRFVLDHPDGCVTEEKLSAELRDTFALNSSGVENHEIRVKILEKNSHNHTNKEILDGITEIPYTKQQIDHTASVLADSVEQLNNNKADISAVTALSESISNNEGYINNLLILTSAHEIDIVRIDADKAVKSEVYTKEEMNSKLETKADISELKASHAWQLLGESELPETARFLTIDLGAPVSEWYNETLFLINVPSLSTNTKNGSFALRASVTEDGGLTTSGTQSTIITTASNSENYGAINYQYNSHLSILTQWIKNSPVSSVLSRRRNGSKAYGQTVAGTVNFESGEKITNSRYITLISLNESDFMFPAGTKISLYGRM